MDKIKQYKEDLRGLIYVLTKYNDQRKMIMDIVDDICNEYNTRLFLKDKTIKKQNERISVLKSL